MGLGCLGANFVARKRTTPAELATCALRASVVGNAPADRGQGMLQDTAAAALGTVAADPQQVTAGICAENFHS